MTSVQTPADRLSSAAALSGIGSKLQKNLIFLVLVTLGNAVGAVMLIGATYAMATEDRFTGAACSPAISPTASRPLSLSPRRCCLSW